jgi:hypothetical protein
MSAKDYKVIPGLLAGSNLSSSQYHVVIFASTAGEVVISDGPDNGMVAGLLQNDPADGEAAEVAYSGIALGITESTAIVFGNVVSSNATGELQIVANDEAKVLGHALETSSAVGDIIKVLVSLSWYGTT